ncbi:unnamed protein product [Cladocopium goreaui]|uniref:N(6)-adenine-specific DNA methyltransferase 2 n=1 Tax=Cladocopium goreaui TaxID=2562237 RepID=A0A9P1DTX4_9DINO|nr:unnamed protein product [Cladocopium goreaui]
MDAAKNFLDATEERADLNQYWFSPATVSTFVAEICDKGGTAALVSTPSVYFSLPEDARKMCKVLDFDRQWQSDPGYVFYDFNQPEELPEELHGSFDFVLIDPPFITREVWEKYAITARFLAAKGACLLCTTIAENAAMMLELMGLHPAKFRPGIPNLVYQYSIYVNYSSDRLKALNPEIDQDDWQRHWRPASRPSDSDPSDPAERPVGAARSEESQPEMEEVPSFEETPELLLLGELRRQLFILKRAIEAIQAPLQMALRRNSKGISGTNQAAAKVDAARLSASEIVDALQQWLEAHGLEVSAAMDGSSEPWHMPELDETRSLLASHELSTDWSQRCRQAAGKLFQRSNQVLERTKMLKAQQKAGIVADVLKRVREKPEISWKLTDSVR